MLMNDVATALSTCVLKDGQQTITADIPFGGNKVTGLGAATDAGDAARFDQTGVTGVVSLDHTDLPLTLTVADRHKAYLVDLSGAVGDETITLPVEATAGDGWGVTIRLTAVASDNLLIKNDAAGTEFTLSDAGETVKIVTDGTSWFNIETSSLSLPTGDDNEVLVYDSTDPTGFTSFGYRPSRRRADNDGGELPVDSETLVDVGSTTGTTTYTLPDSATVSGEREALLELFDSVGGNTEKIILQDHANDGSGVRWIGTSAGDFVRVRFRDTGWFVVGHYETIPIQVHLDTNESVAQGASEKLTNWTVDLDPAGQWNASTDALEPELDYDMDVVHRVTSTALSATIAYAAEIRRASAGAYIVSHATTDTNTGGVNNPVAAVRGFQLSTGTDVELWARSLDTDSGGFSAKAGAAETYATFFLRWRIN